MLIGHPTLKKQLRCHVQNCLLMVDQLSLVSQEQVAVSSTGSMVEKVVLTLGDWQNQCSLWGGRHFLYILLDVCLMKHLSRPALGELRSSPKLLFHNLRMDSGHRGGEIMLRHAVLKVTLMNT